MEVRGELADKTGKGDEVPQKVTPMPRPPPPFPQRLVKKTENGKYRHFITMFKQLSINVPLIEALEQMPDYAEFMNDMLTKRMMIECSIVALLLQGFQCKRKKICTIPCTIGYYTL